MGKKRFFNFKNLFFVSFLAVAGIFSATAIVKNKQVEETPIVEKAEAWEDNWYIRGSFNNWGQTKMNQNGSEWKITQACSAGDEFKFYYSPWGDGGWRGPKKDSGQPATPDAITFSEGNNATIKSDFAGRYNFYYKPDSNQLYYELDCYITRKYSLNGVDKGSETTANEYVRYGNAPSDPSVRTGYTFNGWYDAASGGNKVTSVTTHNITLYAQYTTTVYTITYDRNKSTGLQATQSKNYGTSVTAYTPGSNPLTATGWDPSPYRNFIRWNTKSDDSGDKVNAGSTITSNASFTLYYIEDWYWFQYKVDSGSWITLEHNDEGKGSGVTAQFAPADDEFLPLNGKIYFHYSDDGGASWTDLESVSFEADCNYSTTDGILLETIDKIYLKYLDSGSFSCYVPGKSTRTIAVFDTSSATTGGTPYSMKDDGDNQTVTVMTVYIEKGQYIKRGYGGNYSFGSRFEGGSGTASSCFSQVGENTAVECTKTGAYTVYNKSGNGWQNMWFARDEAKSAKYLAQKFNTIISAICTAVVGGSKSLTDLQNAWGSTSGTELYKHFNGQISDTMDYFKTTSGTTDEDILACVARYDYIENKYGTNALPDFLARNNGYSATPASAISSFSPFNLMNEDGNDISTVIIIIASSVALLSITTLSVLMVRKRKRKED